MHFVVALPEEVVSRRSTKEVNATSLEETTITESSMEVETIEPPLEDFCLGKCPEIDPNLAVHLPHERCDLFCKCSNGKTNVLSCPKGLQYNSQLQVCDWPSSANCTGGDLLPSNFLLVV